MLTHYSAIIARHELPLANDAPAYFDGGVKDFLGVWLVNNATSFDNTSLP